MLPHDLRRRGRATRPAPAFARLLAALVTLLALLLAPGAVAQTVPDVRGPLAAVEIRGATANADIVRVIIAARPGTPAASIDLEAERNRIYGLGTYREVSLSLEPRASGPVLVIDLVENPRVADVRFDGNELVGDAVLASALARENLIEAGEIYNTIRAEDALATIRQAYRTPGAPFFAGLPYDVGVSLRVVPEDEAAADAANTDDGATGETPSTAASTGAVADASTPVVLTYRIEESAPIDALDVQGNTVLDDAEIETIFAALVREDGFDLQGYRTLAGRVDARYRELGYRGSGVDRERTELSNGTLALVIRELRISAVDTTAIGVGPAALTLGAGDLFNYDTLLADVKRLARSRSGDVRLTTALLQGGRVRVGFELGPPESAGPIEEIVIEGNSVFGDDELLALLSLEVGDTFTSTLAREDFGTIARYYQEAGYRLLPTDFYGSANPQPFTYVDGSYILRPVELLIDGYEFDFGESESNVQPFVVTRYLPEPGAVFNANEINGGLRDLSRLEVVQPQGVNLSFAETQPEGGYPNRVTVVVELRRLETGLFQPSAQYATDSGFSGSVSYSQGNLWGRAHSLSVELNGQSSDVGLRFGGSVRYTVPWLYLSYKDLDTTDAPTSLSVSLFSVTDSNQPLTANGSTRIQYPGLPETEANRVDVGETSERNTGFSVSLSRPVAPDTTMRLSARTSFNEIVLEPPATECEFGGDGNVTNGDDCALPSELADDYLPIDGISTFLSGGLLYDGRDNPEFPTDGLYGTLRFGVGFGNDYRDPDGGGRSPYSYQQIEAGGRAYVQLRDISDEIDDPKHVFAFRVNAGHQFGEDYPVSRQFRVGRTTDVTTQIRGYLLEDFNLSQTYVTSSVEYRYDFGFSSFATQTIIAIGFVDVGYASNVPGFPIGEAPLFGAAGLGVQVNLGFGGVLLPALRFDYGFSPTHPGGVFSFSIGTVF